MDNGWTTGGITGGTTDLPHLVETIAQGVAIGPVPGVGLVGAMAVVSAT